jgi:hypothetical protein
LQDFQTHEKNLQGQLVVCTEMKIHTIILQQQKKSFLWAPADINHRCAVCSSIGKLHQISEHEQLSVVYIRWTFMGLEEAVNGVDRTRTFSILVQSVSVVMA